MGMEDEGELLFKMIPFSGGDSVIFGGRVRFEMSHAHTRNFCYPSQDASAMWQVKVLFLMVKCDYLEPQTSSLKWMFGDFQPFPTSKDLVHHPIETTVYKWFLGFQAVIKLFKKISEKYIRVFSQSRDLPVALNKKISSQFLFLFVVKLSIH